jgi:thioredoxin reductase (NADPH)
MQKKFWPSGVSFIGSFEVIDVIGDEHVTAVQSRNIRTTDVKALSVSAIFVTIGRIPATEVFRDALQVDSRGHSVRIGNTTATNVPGVFVAGDCADPMYRQAITSAGTGCQAALDAERWILLSEATESERPREFL